MIHEDDSIGHSVRHRHKLVNFWVVSQPRKSFGSGSSIKKWVAIPTVGASPLNSNIEKRAETKSQVNKRFISVTILLLSNPEKSSLSPAAMTVAAARWLHRRPWWRENCVRRGRGWWQWSSPEITDWDTTCYSVCSSVCPGTGDLLLLLLTITTTNTGCFPCVGDHQYFGV